MMSDINEALEALARLQGSADQDYNTIREHLVALREENMRLMQWVHDLQSGMYINCVYCGHRYGPSDEVPATMADALKEHVEQCPEHPMSELRRALERQRFPELTDDAAVLCVAEAIHSAEPKPPGPTDPPVEFMKGSIKERYLRMARAAIHSLAAAPEPEDSDGSR